jgi:gamma-glutamyl phosphate reductase
VTTGTGRAAARLLTGASLERRLDACRRAGVERNVDVDPVGKVLSGVRTREGLRVVTSTVPLGIVAVESADEDAVADCLVDANAVVIVTGGDGAAVALADRFRDALVNAGLPENAVQATDSLADVEVDAVLRPGGAVIAERVGTHRHLYVDAEADRTHATYVCVNAAAHAAADTIVFHAEYPDDAVDDVVTALGHLGKSPTLVRAASLGDAVDLIDRRSSGEVETVLTANLRVLRDLERRVDAAVLVENASPAFAGPTSVQRQLHGLTRTRTVIEGEGQTRPLFPGR